jgi:hypothetical protein
MEILRGNKRISPWIIGIIGLWVLFHLASPMSRGPADLALVTSGGAMIYYGLRYGKPWWNVSLFALGALLVSYGCALQIGFFLE